MNGEIKEGVTTQLGMNTTYQEYEEIDGDTNLIFRLMNGEWDEEDFLIIPPGNRIIATNKEIRG